MHRRQSFPAQALPGADATELDLFFAQLARHMLRRLGNTMSRVQRLHSRHLAEAEAQWITRGRVGGYSGASHRPEGND